MIKLSELRTILLKQHADIRALLDETRAASSQVPIDQERLTGALGRLVTLVQTHNAAEEEALRKILPTIDAWGPVRNEVMLHEHLTEHTELYLMLLEASKANLPAGLPATLAELLDKFAKHMAYEEKTFLGPETLDEDALVAAFGG